MLERSSWVRWKSVKRSIVWIFMSSAKQIIYERPHITDDTKTRKPCTKWKKEAQETPHSSPSRVAGRNKYGCAALHNTLLPHNSPTTTLRLYVLPNCFLPTLPWTLFDSATPRIIASFRPRIPNLAVYSQNPIVVPPRYLSYYQRVQYIVTTKQQT